MGSEESEQQLMNLIKGSKNDNFKLVRHCYGVCARLKVLSYSRLFYDINFLMLSDSRVSLACIIRFLMLFMKRGFNFNYRAIGYAKMYSRARGHFSRIERGSRRGFGFVL
jgi:hypothetical protein